MPTFFRNITPLVLLAVLCTGCVQENLEDFPPIERQGNVYALFEPGKPLQLQAAVTGYSLDRVNFLDSTRVQSKLYANGQLLENFNLQSNTRIALGKSYRLTCVIDNRYEVAGSIQLPLDSLLIDSLAVSPLPQPIAFVRDNGRPAELSFTHSFAVSTSPGHAAETIYLSRDEPALLPYYSNDFFDNGERVQVLSGPFPQQINVRKVNAATPVSLYQINADFYHFLVQARDPLVVPEVVPGNVSFSNMEKGVGLMAWQIVYHR